MNIGELLISALAGPLETVAKAKLIELFNSLYTKNPDTYKTAMTALYAVVDVQLEGLVDGTKNKIDDAVVNALKEAIEESAKANGLTLTNLDND